MRRAWSVVKAEREASARFEAWVTPAPRKLDAKGKPARKKPAAGPALVARAVEEMTEIRTGEAWHRAQPKHFVALYASLHEHVYGVKPIELGKEWPFAVSACRKLMKDEFEADPLRFVKFMQWVWADEVKAAKKRDASNTFRIGWKYMFVSRGMVTNYRVVQVRAGKGKR